MTREIIETNTYKVALLPKDIVHIHFKPSICIEVEDIKATFAIYQELAVYQDFKILVEFPMYTTITTEAREYGAASDLKAIAEAFVIETLAQRILARFYKVFHKKNHPLKIFMDKNEALGWLQNYDK